MVRGAVDAAASSRDELMDLVPGTTIGGRYRLLRPAWDTTSGVAWLAHDEVLERPVLIQTFPGASADALGRAVARSAQVTHPGICQIYDMSTDPPAIVFEHAPGGRLADRKDGALPLAEAARVVCQLVSAIGALHEHGIAHGSISPEAVLFDEEGRPKLTGALVSDELGSTARPDPYRSAGEGTGAEENDRYALAGVAYRLFTGREPGPDAPPARSARRGIPPTVDALLSRALARDAAARPSLQEFRRVLDPIAATEPGERGPGFFRQEMRWLVPVLIVLGLGGAAIAIGVQQGAIRIGGAKTTSSPTASPAIVKVASVDDFDPEGRPPEEHPDDAHLAIDGSPKGKGWSTVGYQSETFGRLKTGVGLVFDLGESRPSVARIEVATSLPGWKAEWRVADSAGSSADDYSTILTFDADGRPNSIAPTRRARYWLLWIVRLVNNESNSDNPYQAQVAEVSFFST